MSGQVWITVTVKHDTGHGGNVAGGALLCEHGAGEDQWIPHSQIQDYSDDYKVGDTIEIELPEWLALDKGMI